MKVFDLSTNSEVELYTLREVGQRVIVGAYGTAESRMKDLQNDPEISTPAPDHVINETDYWKKDSLEAWARAYQQSQDMENERKRIKLEEGKIGFSEIIDTLITQVNQVKRLNARAYKHNRGNSLQDARLRILELDGALTFVTALLATVDLNYTAEQRDSIHKAIAEMKDAVQMR